MSIKIENLPKKTKLIENILSVYNNATDDDFIEGMEWYPNAYNICKSVAEVSPYTVEQIAGVMAILSPAMVWDANEKAPSRVIDLHWNGVPHTEWTGFATYPHNLKKAEMVLDEEMEAIRGNKVVSFYNNILGNQFDYVTVDRWAARVAMGTPHIKGPQAVPSGKKTYNYIAIGYRKVAEIAEIPPREVQAITWISFRRMYNGRVVLKNRVAPLYADDSMEGLVVA